MLIIKRGKYGNGAIAWIFFFILSVRLINNCQEDKAHARSYPRVKTNPVSNITVNGATFNGDIYSLGTEPIINHGFVWGTDEDPNIINNSKILLGTINNGGPYSADIITDLFKGTEYTVKSFVQTAEHVVYGPPVTFISLGSGAPVIEGFKPKSAEWMDTVTVKGKNFSWVKSENIVRLNQMVCTVLTSADTVVSFLVSKDLSDLKSVMSVERSGNKSVFIKDTFNLIAPVIKSYYPMEANWNDTITVSGERFESEHFHNEISATINGYSASVTARGKEFISLIVPQELITISNPVEITFNKLIVRVQENFILKPPVISGIYPKEGFWGDIITIRGKFHPQKERNIISIGGIPSYIISNNRDSIRVYTGNLTEPSNIVVNNSEPFTVISPDTFKLFPPLIKSITPLSGIPWSTVSISGDYFYFVDVAVPKVRFGTEDAILSGYNKNIINFYVPATAINGPVSITVTTGSQSTVYKDLYNVVNPVITDVSPLAGTYNDQVTLEGENLLLVNQSVVFISSGQAEQTGAYIISSSMTKLVVAVPYTLDSIPKILGIVGNNHIITSYSQKEFILDPPEIYSVTPSTFSTGQTLTISGKNFNPYQLYNEVLWGEYPLLVQSSTAEQIIVLVPSSLPSGVNKISVKTSGYKRYSTETYHY